MKAEPTEGSFMLYGTVQIVGHQILLHVGGIWEGKQAEFCLQVWTTTCPPEQQVGVDGGSDMMLRSNNAVP